MGFALRRAGTTVPTADLVIAASALEQRVPILHSDEHFTLIGDHTDLEPQGLP